jgi:hypothetical protein
MASRHSRSVELATGHGIPSATQVDVPDGGMQQCWPAVHVRFAPPSTRLNGQKTPGLLSGNSLGAGEHTGASTPLSPPPPLEVDEELVDPELDAEVVDPESISCPPASGMLDVDESFELAPVVVEEPLLEAPPSLPVTFSIPRTALHPTTVATAAPMATNAVSSLDFVSTLRTSRQRRHLAVR